MSPVPSSEYDVRHSCLLCGGPLRTIPDRALNNYGEVSFAPGTSIRPRPDSRWNRPAAPARSSHTDFFGCGPRRCRRRVLADRNSVGQVHNPGTGRTVRVSEVHRLAAEQMGPPPIFIRSSVPESPNPMADMSRTRGLSRHPSIDLTEGIRGCVVEERRVLAIEASGWFVVARRECYRPLSSRLRDCARASLSLRPPCRACSDPEVRPAAAIVSEGQRTLPGGDDKSGRGRSRTSNAPDHAPHDRSRRSLRDSAVPARTPRHGGTRRLPRTPLRLPTALGRGSASPPRQRACGVRRGRMGS
ncbi:hypothetical protein UA74_05305 [Actinoalloteichus fjordicus]|uniref:Uncharacterized protein n=1 Tax=Actinoalloteichus fjordicus TaxID=1612552 RepID=A0AAC9L8P8_9PSEU|nr:hypothetical protein UA74_05305 [Actinoalloteichus fjordicus]